MTDLITEARELCEDVTPGQWKRHDTADYAEIHNGDTWGKDLSPIALVGHTDDANFIARSRTLIPELCDALEKAQDEKQREFDIATGYYNKWQKALTELDRLTEAQRWIPVSEKPRRTQNCLCLFNDGSMAIAWCNGVPYEFHPDITHWMPLPAPPEKEGE